VFAVYERFQGDIKQLESQRKAHGDQPSFSDALAATGKLAEVFCEVRLAQVKALAEVGMNEQEYRDIQMAVYKTAWASETEKQTGRTPAAAVREANAQMREALRKGMEEARRQGVNVPPTESEQKAEESEKETAEAASALEVPAANIALFRKYEADIRKYSMNGLEMIGF
jgi:Fe-S cluster biosynthesis and repair protein YggX